MRPSRKSWAVAAILTMAVVLDFWPRSEVIALEELAVYDRLKSEPKRVLLELPLGIRDGFGERGRFEHASLYYQTVHAHPLVGGIVARLSPRITDRYERDYVFGRLLELAEQGKEEPLNPPAESLVCSVGFVSMPSDLDEKTRAFVGSVFVLRPLATSAPRSLYEVAGFHAPYCPKLGHKEFESK
jgi:hypothetical protein